MESIPIPNSFVVAMQSQLGNEYPAFLEALKAPATASIRKNPQKNYHFSSDFEKVKWNAHGVYLSKRPIYTLDPAFHGGAYYVQEASSMFVSEALQQVADLSQPLTILDLCAAPGGKSTDILSTISSDSLLVSNEVINSRYKVLKENLTKWGFPNMAITNHDVSHFSDLRGYFDVVIVDAPCSGEGLWRKDEGAISEWSPENVLLCAARQKRILKDAVPLIKQGGVLIYCTCTYNHIENKDNIEWLLDNFPLHLFPLSLPTDWNIKAIQDKDTSIGYQFYPHLVKGEGFFISCFQKTEEASRKSGPNKRKVNFKNLSKLSKKKVQLLEEWIVDISQLDFFELATGQVVALPKNLLSSFYDLDQGLYKKQFGLRIGSFKKTDFIPSHDLALSRLIHPNIPFVEVDKEVALQFLKKGNLTLRSSQKGWQLIRYQGLNLGWVKALLGRVNNYYPKEWRIRMEI